MEGRTASPEYRAGAPANAAEGFDADKPVRPPIPGERPPTGQPERAVVERLAGRSVSLPIARSSIMLPVRQRSRSTTWASPRGLHLIVTAQFFDEPRDPSAKRSRKPAALASKRPATGCFPGQRSNTIQPS